MTHDLLKLAEECEKREVHFKQWNDTLNEAELFHKLATALREAQAEIEKAHAIFGPDTTIEMLEEGLEARAELPKLRAELEAAKCLSKHAVECMDRCCPQCNAAMKEKA